MTGYLAVILIAEIHISIAVIVAQLLRAVLNTVALPVVILGLRRPCRNLIGQLGIQIFFKIFPIAALGAPAVHIDTVDAKRLILQPLELTGALNGGDDRNNRRNADDDTQHGQDRAHLVVQDGLERHADGLHPVHVPLPPSVGASEMMRPS